MEWVIAGILILLLILIGLILKRVSTIISKIEPPVADKLVKNTEKSEILQYLEPISNNKEISDKISGLAAQGASSPSLLKLTSSTLPQHLINSAAYLNMGQLYRLNRQVIGTQMNYGSGIGSSVMGTNGKIVGHNSFMPLGIPLGLLLYQAGTIIFSAAHFEKLFLDNKLLEKLAHLLFIGWHKVRGEDTLPERQKAYLQNFQESLPDMPLITKKIPSKPEIYVVRNDKDFLVYTPMD